MGVILSPRFVCTSAADYCRQVRASTLLSASDGPDSRSLRRLVQENIREKSEEITSG
jgi:hypothetical protein